MSGSQENNLPEILCVDDDPVTQSIVRLFLKGQCNVVFASTHKEAIEIARKKKFKAVLMDINLGGGSTTGLELIKDLKNIDGFNDIPFVAVTAYAMSGDKEEFLSKGCTHYISKPFDRPSLQELLRQIIN
ncbi:MAG: hypothetical protein Kow0098_18350 [Ignavibacteriaceae bacterium]